MMRAAMCWRIMGSKTTEPSAKALFTRFGLTGDEADAVNTFCELIGCDEMDEETSKAIREAEGVLVTACMMAKGRVLADPHTALQQLYRPRTAEDENALF